MTADKNAEQSHMRRTDTEDAAIWARFAGKAGEDARVTAMHRLKIAGTSPEGFALYMRAIIPPDELRGEMLMRGIWRIGMDRIELDSGLAPWSQSMPSRHYADRLHRFDWLPDLFSHEPGGPDCARSIVDDWIENFGRFDGFTWRVGCTADRIWNWMRCGTALFEQGDTEAAGLRLETLGRQVRHIMASADMLMDPRARWRCSVLIVAYTLCLGHGKGLDSALMRLENECTAQILPDGGHVSRSPARALRCLADLLALKDLLVRSERDVPDFLQKWCLRLGGMIAFFQSADGALTPFHDGNESWPSTVTAVLENLTATPRRFSVAPKSGFQKLHKNGTLVILDAGHAPENPFGDLAHAGTLGFELHDGQARLVTSCGSSPEIDVTFRAAVRRTSAHSTLVLEGEDSCRFNLNEETQLLFPVGPDGISAKRLEEADEIWLDAQHSGYKNKFGLLHRRRLFLSADGGRLTGEDSLARPISAGTAEADLEYHYALRFHLHPTVTATTAADSIILSSDIGAKWRFKTSHARARLEETIYLARGIVERSAQIVLSGKVKANSDGLQPPNCIRWAFLRI